MAIYLTLASVTAAAQTAQAPVTATRADAIVVPAGTSVSAVLLRPVRAATAKVGDPLYMQTNFPVAVNGTVAIPAGTYVAAHIEKLTPPTRKVSRAEFYLRFTQLIFANGYARTLPDSDNPTASVKTDHAGTRSVVEVQVSTANDILLDNGAQVTFTLPAALPMHASAIAQAIPKSIEIAPKPGQFKSATRCRFIPGTPATPGTPGTSSIVIPGSPGTPDTVIPSGDPSIPDTVIPGTPATPDVIIPGTPGTAGDPGTPDQTCPAPPSVLSSTPTVPLAAPSKKRK